MRGSTRGQSDFAVSSLDDDFFGGTPPAGGNQFDQRFAPSDRASGSDAMRPRADSSIDKAFDLAAINPLVSAAAPLLWLAGRLNESAPPDNIAEFRDLTINEIKRFETAAMAKDVPSRIVRIARYALCATIDDIILNTKWGGQSGWASGSLVSSLYNETWGGERFYDLLSQLQMSPEENVDALELMAICLAVGFVGKYRVVEGGQGQLTRLRHDLYRAIRRVRGPYDRDLSATWQGVTAPHKPPRIMADPWLAGMIVLGLLAALWIFSSLSLRGSVEAAAEQIKALAPATPIVVDHAAVPAIPEPVPPTRQTQIERISAFLADDIANGSVEVSPSGSSVVIRMLKASFPSGGKDIAPSEDPLIGRIGSALNGEKGPILVIGHTDNVPVGAGSPLGDNMAISVARASSAADMLRRHVSDPSRVTFEGRGENDPIASNATAEGRARNRRVEFQIPMEPAP
jgi:type VI secretion system protein ImpK